MKIKLSALSVFALLSFSASAYDYETPQQAIHHDHEVNEELDGKYSRHQGIENLDQRFWVVYNDATVAVIAARDRVYTTTSFVYSHNMAMLSDGEQGEYQGLVSQERLAMKRYLLLRDELINLIFNARNAGADVSRYEARLVELMADVTRLDKYIQDRPY